MELRVGVELTVRGYQQQQQTSQPLPGAFPEGVLWDVPGHPGKTLYLSHFEREVIQMVRRDRELSISIGGGRPGEVGGVKGSQGVSFSPSS